MLACSVILGCLLRWVPYIHSTHSSMSVKPVNWNLADLPGKPELEPEPVPGPGPMVDKEGNTACSHSPMTWEVKTGNDNRCILETSMLDYF